MKNVKFLLMLMFVSLLIGNGCRKDESLEFENYVIEKRTSHFLDTSYFEFHHIINILSEQSDSMIAFQTKYGFPSVYGTFKKKNETIKITTIPLVKYNKITGVFRIYITHEDSVRIHFFSKENIDSAMTTSLNSKNFHLYNGAIQGYVFSAAKRGETIDNKYIQWLEGNQNRLEERVGFYCIEDWDCIEAFRDSNTGNIYSDREFTDYIGPGINASGNGLYGFFHCFLISYECYYDWSQHGYISSSGNNWNHYPWVTNSSSGGTGYGNNNPKIKPWEEQVLIDAKDCLLQAGIAGARAMAALQNATDNSCGESYNDLLARTYLNLMDKGKSCTDVAALAEEVENTIAKTETVFFDDQVLEFFEENELIDPCSGEKISDMLKNEACANQETLTMEGLEEALEGVDYIEIPVGFESECPCFYKILNNLKNGNNDNWLCKIVKDIESSASYTQKFKIHSGEEIKNTMNASLSVGTILIPESFCNGNAPISDLEITAKFIHELLHGYISVLLKEQYPGTLPNDFYVQSPFNPELLVINYAYWSDIVQAKYPGTIINGNQHILFLTHFKNLIINALHDINGGIGNPTDYEYYANLIINTNDLALYNPFAYELGLKDSDGNVIFNNDNYLAAWNSIGGNAGFSINCE